MSFTSNVRLDGIQRVEIPSTVELIGHGAFIGNKRLFNRENELNEERFKLLDNKTVVLKQHY